MALTGEPLTAAQVLDAGLLNYVVPRAHLDQRVERLLARVADKSPSAIRRGPYAMGRMQSMPFEESMAFMEGQIGLAAFTEDAREGVKAFRERREPVWTGR